MEQRIKVFIADESPEFRHAMRENLTRAGIDVVDETDSGIDVLTKIKRSTPDVVLIDVWLPKLDTVQIIKKAKTLFQNPANVPDFMYFHTVQIQTFLRKQPRREQHIACTSRLNMQRSSKESHVFIKTVRARTKIR